MEKLPKEAINKIMFFLSHPVADIFKIELEEAHQAFLTREFTSMLREQEQLYCDCCANLWSECHCMCSHCHGNYRECRYNCYDDQYDEEHEEDRRQWLIRIEEEEEMTRIEEELNIMNH